MDMRTLVVGQKVSMTKSGFYANWREVVEISSSCVAVKTEGGEVLRFDKNGKQTNLGQSEIWCRAGYPEFPLYTLNERSNQLYGLTKTTSRFNMAPYDMSVTGLWKHFP